ncbi:actin filament-associated protein 1-like 2 isoform 3-T3 [Odontesthes bonariensis]|uniref:actin filament-associated protein 1-like 2 isoform X3 n=1 Tax=Odontesthes bonariensis TaxID=219752 RepID=UPI003F58283E
MDKQKVLAKLIWDLQSFLSVLDSENLSYIAQAQKKSISELLSRLQTQDTPVEDAEYMIMSCPSSSPSNELTDTPGTEGVWSSEPVSNKDSSTWLRNVMQGLTVPPPPPGGDDEEDTYEEAEPYVAADTTVSNTAEPADSDSSHYESYGEEEEEEDDYEGAELVKDRAHYIQWSASQPCLRPAPESRLCGYLWRRKWLGQWSKQLFIVRNDTLLCYKCARDLLPQLELNLRGCQLVYKSKSNAKIQHQLKVVPRGSDSLVLGYSSFQQADEWRKVMEEVSVGGEVQTRSFSSLNKLDQLLSCRSSTVQTDSDEEKPSAPCSLNRDKGFLNVLMNCQWQSLLCQVDGEILNMFGEEEEVERSPQYTVQLRGCEVTACEVTASDSGRSYRITLSMLGDRVAVLEASSAEERQRWLKLLQDGAAGHHDDSTQKHTGGALSGLQIRRFPTSNTYMDDPFSLSGAGRDQPVYSNSCMLEHILHSSQDSVHRSSVSSKDSVTYSNLSSHSMKPAEVQRGVQKLELAGRRTVQLRAGSETNLASAGRQNKRSSFRQSLAICTERAQVGFLNPLLRRTASAKTSLRRAPSALFIEHGKVFQKKKEWETKAAV